MSGGAWILLAAVGIAMARATRTRKRRESRSRLLEVLARAARRGVPLPPIVTHVAAETPGENGHWIRRTAEALGNGASLGEALAATDRNWVPRHIAEAVTAAEGTDRLPDTLDALVIEDRRGLAHRHRMGALLLYPAVVLVLVTLSPGLLAVRRTALALDAPVPPAWITTVSLAVAGLLVGGLVFGSLLRRLGVMPLTGLRSSARLLRTAGTLLVAGLPLGETLRRAGSVSGNVWLSLRARRAGRAVDRGDAPAEAWTSLRLPAFARARLLAAEGARLTTALAESAEICEERYEAANERLQRLGYPLALLVVGALVAVHFAGVFRFIGSVQEGLW